jgi:hypothetical protein
MAYYIIIIMIIIIFIITVTTLVGGIQNSDSTFKVQKRSYTFEDFISVSF